MQSRRNFINSVAGGLAGTLAASNVLGANERVRLGIIGPGARGSEILRQAVSLENVECIGAADVYTRRLEQAKQIAPNAKTYLDYHRMLEDKDIDAVLIATPQHLHAECFTAALDAGKHVYQEKTMAFTVEHAKKMRAAYHHAGEKRVVQIGHQWTSTGQLPDALSFLKPD
jgi:predicted dehydrogenase